MSRSPFFRPAITGDPFWDMWSPERFFDSHFGANLTEDDFFAPTMVPSYFLRRRTLGAPRSPLMPHSPIGPQAGEQAAHPLAKPPGAPGSGAVVMPQPSSDKYQIMVDVSHFTPEEITVKTVDNTIVVIGKHEDKADNYGYVSRQFSRKYLLPADVEPETVTSTLSADGILSIQAPRKPLQLKDTDGRAVPIAISNQMLSPVHNLAAPQFPPSQAPPAPAANTPIPVTSEQSAPAAAPAPAAPSAQPQ